MKSKESRPYLGFLKEYAFKKKLLPSYILTIATIVLTAGVSLVRPELQGKVIDDLGNPHSTSLSAFMLLLVVFLGMLLLNYLMNYVQRYIVAVISEEIAADMRQKVEDKLSTVSVNFFEKIKLSDILLKVDKDVSAVKQCGITSIITLVSNIVILVVVPPYMFSIHKGIAVSNIILLVSVPFISRILGKLIQETSGQVLEGYNSITNVLTNTYDNWFITRLFQCGQYVHDMYFEKNQKYKKETNRQNLLYILNTSTILVIQFIGTVIIWVVGAQEVFKQCYFLTNRIEEPLEQRFIREVTRTERCDTFESGMEKLRNIKTAEQYPVLFIDHNNYQEICEYKERIRVYAMENPKTEIILRYPLFNMVERLDFQKKTNRNLNQFTV